MGGKKKAGGGKGKGKGAAAGQDGDDIAEMIDKFFKLYKKNCTALEVPQSSIVKDK